MSLDSLPGWLPLAIAVILLLKFWPQLRALASRYVPGL